MEQRLGWIGQFWYPRLFPRCHRWRLPCMQISNSLFTEIPWIFLPRSQSILRNQELAVRPDHRGSGRKDLVQGDLSRRGLEQNERRSA